MTDAAGFPLRVEAFEGNRAETATMLPTLPAFMAAHRLTDVTVVADAGTISEGNRRSIEAAGLSFILGAKIPQVPYVITEWRAQHPGQDVPDGLLLTQPGPPGTPTSVVTRSSTTSSPLIELGARCTGSTSRAARPNARWRGRTTGSCRSSAPSACPSTTWPHGRSITTNALPSRRT
ncbi:MAG: transposase [Pseudonocardia sp.]|nr:transposase [Pseudonocardia sp.]